MRIFKILMVSAFVAGNVINSYGEIKLPSWVSDNMIVQQNSEMNIKGKAAPKSKVNVNTGWLSAPLVATADSKGDFSVNVPTPSAGGPYFISFTDKDGEVKIENVLSGEVWLCSGQSNMEFPMQGWGTVMNNDIEVATAYHPEIRLLQVKKRTSIVPEDDVEVNNGGWQICSPGSVADFSAIAYLFAREISQKLGIPVGVIDTTWGGTPAEAWTSQKALADVPGFENELADLKAAGYDKHNLDEIYSKKNREWLESCTVSNADFDKAALQTGKDWQPIMIPGYWENSVLPDFDGMVWLQTEFTLPEDFQSQHAEINFAAIDDEDETYVNGVLVGKGSGYNTPRSYTIPSQVLKPGKNVVTVRVSDFGGEGGIVPGKTELVMDNQSISLAGDWQYLIEKNFSNMPPKPISPDSSSYPSVLYNAMLSPLKDMPVKGVLWYQGCANVGRDEQYEPLFQALIKDWRNLWGEDMPFYFVQLAGFLKPQAVQPDSKWAALRNAQAKALCLEHTGMATAIDLGNPADIHPTNKQDVAHRLALIALNKDYGFNNAYAGPVCESVDYQPDGIVLNFNEEVVPASSAITGFIIAGDDGVFTTATPAIIGKKTIKLSASGIKNPSMVKYNWADFPCGNLYGATGLPVTPFENEK